MAWHRPQGRCGSSVAAAHPVAPCATTGDLAMTSGASGIEGRGVPAGAAPGCSSGVGSGGGSATPGTASAEQDVGAARTLPGSATGWMSST
mmetsp:Transcript_57572/g.159288  ORF Transcript_57572/g.159288 Transcript_57572/m.159288 type:complete len:91 (+) Transcript_57572:585-857(+)